MLIDLDEQTTLGDLSNAFRAAYPFLKICFYKKPLQWKGATHLQHLLDSSATIASVSKTTARPAYFALDARQKTRDAEQQFRVLLGLYAQVYRKYHDRWVQTVGSDELTLAEQNALGQADAGL